MSVADESVTSPFAEAGRGAKLKSPTWSWIDGILEAIGERLNPILVKETRQALKSRQFTVTFWLLLLFGAGWSFVGVSLMMPRVYYLPSGPAMLTGYYLILAIPLLLVVPFSAFRSLASEREDGTYELLSITSLSSRQIVTGKLGSALLQMLVYYAALAPCVAFTYLLRGVDIGLIVVVLVGTFLISTLLSTVGLVFAGMHSSRQWQALSSVLLLLLLIFAGWIWGYMMIAMVYVGSSAMGSPVFWLGIACFLTIYATFLTILILVAAAQNSFASDNRSTKIRVALLIQLILFAGWMMFFWLYLEERAFVYIATIFAGIFWSLYGALLTGEHAELSPRAKRDLPQTFLGRTFLTWLNPGSATGYVFITVSFFCFMAVLQSANLAAAANWPAVSEDPSNALPFGVLMWAYMAFYLGLGRLLIAWLRTVSHFGMATVMMVHILVLTLATALPTFLQYWLQDFRDADYSELQAMNWIWSLVEAADGSWGMVDVMAIAVTAGVLMFVLQLFLAAREIEAVRQATPERVRVDDAELAT